MNISSKTTLKKKLIEVLGKLKEIDRKDIDIATTQNTDNKNYLLISKKNLNQFMFELIEKEMFYKDAGLNSAFNVLVYLRLLEGDESFKADFDKHLNQTISDTEIDVNEVNPGTIFSSALLLDTNINNLLLENNEEIDKEEKKENIEAAFIAAFVMATVIIMFNERIEIEEAKDVSGGFLQDEQKN